MTCVGLELEHKFCSKANKKNLKPKEMLINNMQDAIALNSGSFAEGTYGSSSINKCPL